MNHSGDDAVFSGLSEKPNSFKYGHGNTQQVGDATSLLVLLRFQIRRPYASHQSGEGKYGIIDYFPSPKLQYNTRPVFAEKKKEYLGKRLHFLLSNSS